MYNKKYTHKINDKKILHKVKKQWVTISIALLAMIGGGGIAATSTHVNAASTNSVNNNSNIQVNKNTSSRSSNLKLVNSNPSYENIANTSASVKSNGNAKNVSSSNVLESKSAIKNDSSQNVSSEATSNVSSNTVNKHLNLGVTNNSNNSNNSKTSMPKTITDWAITNPQQYINALISNSHLDSKAQNAVNTLLSDNDVKEFANKVLYHLTTPYVVRYINASNKALSTFPSLLNSIAYNSSNWPVYRGVAVNTLYGNLYPAYRGPVSNQAISDLLKSSIINTDNRTDLINSIMYVMSLVSKVQNVAGAMGHNNDGMTYTTVSNPALVSSNNHSTGYTNSDPNNQMAFNDDELVDPLFNQNYHYSDPEGAINDIQTILPHYDGNKLDYWNVYYLWNPNSNWIGDQWYHAKTKDFIHFYPGVDANDPASVKNAAIPDPDFRFNGSTVNANNPKAGPSAGKSIEVDSNNKNPIPWGQVATGSVVYNDAINPSGILKQDQWGNKINAHAKLAYFATFVDQTVPDDGIYLAYSNNGQQFHPYQTKPIMSTDTVDLPDGANFRDTYVTPCNNNKELSAYVAGDSKDNKPEIYVLTSTDGTHWNWRKNLAMYIGPYLSNSTNNPNIITIDETPHVAQLNGQPVLMFGYQHQLAGGQSTGTKKDEGVAYLTGHFNNEGIFQLNDVKSDPFRYLDQGFDNYAGNMVPVGKDAVYLGWLGNWGYSPILDYSAYKTGSMHQGTFTLPRIMHWNNVTKQIESYPIEPGNEHKVETAYLNDDLDGVPVSSNGKTVIEFNNPANNFKVNLVRSGSNHIDVAFNNGHLNVSRTDDINPDMNMSKDIDYIGTNTLNNIQFYLDNASVEMYIPQVKKFYTILDLDYVKNNPYQIKSNQPAKVTEYTFDMNQPNAFDTNLSNQNQDRLQTYNNEYQSLLPNELRGKRIAFLGSNFTQSGLVNDIKNDYDLNNPYLSNANGTSMGGISSINYYQRLIHMNTNQHFDAFAVQLSTSDTRDFHKPLGNISKTENYSSFNTTTTTGAIEYITKYIYDHYHCPIVYYTAMDFDDPAYKNIINRLYQLQNKWHFQVIDLYDNKSLTHEMNSSKYMFDDTDLTPSGNALIAKVLGKSLNGDLITNANENKYRKILQGKHIGFLGSSITNGWLNEGHSFVDDLANQDGVVADKQAHSNSVGTPMAGPIGPLKDGQPTYIPGSTSYLNRMMQFMHGPYNAFVAQLSTNDATQHLPLGSISASTDYRDFDTKTVTGSIEFIAKYVQDHYHCPLIFYTCMDRNTGSWQYYQQMVQRLYQLQNKWHFKILDLYDNPNLQHFYNDGNQYLADNLGGMRMHPTAKGYQEEMPYFEQALTNAMSSNSNNSSESEAHQIVKNNAQNNIKQIVNTIQNDLSKITEYTNDANSANGVESNVYNSYANDFEHDIDVELDQYQKQLGVLQSVHTTNNAINNSIVENQGNLHYYDQNGQLAKNYMLHIDGNVYCYFNGNGDGKFFYYNPSNNVETKNLQSSANLMNQLPTIINDKIKGNTVAEQAFTDLLTRINTNNIPNLETGVSGASSNFSTDAMSPFIHNLFSNVAGDLNTLGTSLNVPMLTQIGSTIKSQLVSNLYGIGILAGGPFNFHRIIYNVLTSIYFKALRSYIPYVQGAEVVYNNPTSIAAYNDMLYKFHDMLTEDSPVSQAYTMKAIYHDMNVIGATPGLPTEMRQYNQNLLKIENMDNDLGIDHAEASEAASDKNVATDPSVIDAINKDEDIINNNQSIINSNSANAVKNNDVSAMNNVQNGSLTASSAASNAQVLAVNMDQSSEQVNSARAEISSEVSASYSASASASYSASYSASASASYSASYSKSASNSYKANYDRIYSSSVISSYNASYSKSVSANYNAYYSASVSGSYSASYSASVSASYSASYSASVSASYSASYSASVSASYSAHYNELYAQNQRHINDMNNDIKYVKKLGLDVSNNKLCSIVIRGDAEIIKAVNSDLHQHLTDINQVTRDVNIANKAMSDAYSVYYNYITGAKKQ